MKLIFRYSFAKTLTGLQLLSLVQCFYYDVYYKWKTIEYNIPSNVQLNSTEYIPRNNIVSQLKIYENRMWITTPRYLLGVPVTLSTVPYSNRYHWWEPFFMLHNESPKLNPFPSYEMNKLGDCDAIQSAGALDIDSFGRLWVVDVGRINVLGPYQMKGEAINLCPAKLVIFDVKYGRSDLIFTYTFPENVVPNATAIVKDMQVACYTKNDCWAFIPNINLNLLVVYDHKNRQSWTAQHPAMAPDPYKTNFLVNGVPFVYGFGIVGIALSPRRTNFTDLYFSPLSSTTLYKIKTECVMNPALKQNGTLPISDVINLGDKPGQSNGFAMTSKGELFYGNLPGNSIVSTKTSTKLMEIDDQDTVAQSDVDLLWPNGFGFDGKGKLALTSTKFHLMQMTDPEEYNYRVLLLRHQGHLYSYDSLKD